MKHRTLLLASFALLAACTQSPSAVTVLSGDFGTDGPETVRINSGDIDTTVTLVDGKFSISLPTDIYSLGVIRGSGLRLPLVLDGTPLSIENAEDGSYKIVSAKPAISVQQHLSDAFLFEQELGGKVREFRSTLSGEELSAAVDSLYKVYGDHRAQIVKENKDNVLALYFFPDDLEPAEAITLLDSFSQGVKDSENYKSIHDRYENLVTTGAGNKFIDFEVVQYPDAKDTKTVKFSDYVGQGKYVLVDFWASWCGPCRAEVPNLKAVYERYKGPEFDILGVAVWDKPEDTEAAIKELGEEWPQIINAQKIPTDIYGIAGIPHIMLVGPDGTILARDLRGSAISEEIAKYLD